MHATASAGHVVVLSGLTLFFTFALLTAFPQGFLSSVGFGCGKTLSYFFFQPSCHSCFFFPFLSVVHPTGAIVLTSILSNLTVTPCVLLYCDCFMIFEAFPSAASCCCCFLSKQKQLPPPSATGEVQLTNVNQQAGTSEPLTVINDASRVEVADTGEVLVTSVNQGRKAELLTHTEKSVKSQEIKV